MHQEKEGRVNYAGVRPPDEDVLEAARLYTQGWTYKELGKKFNRSQSNIWVWINKFAEEITNPDMNKRIRKCKRAEKARRIFGVEAPATIDSRPASKETESAEEKIRRLERELADARMARDLYNEMINVAEKQFNINIRKKAGTRQ